MRIRIRIIASLKWVLFGIFLIAFLSSSIIFGDELALKTKPFLRFRNPYTGEHYFQIKEKDISHILQRGYQEESSPELLNSPIFYIYSEQYQKTIPIYEMQRSDIEPPRFITDSRERTEMIASGWLECGIVGYLYEIPVEGVSEIYRVMNQITGDTVYTSSTEEKNFYVEKMNWTLMPSLGFAQSMSSIGAGILAPTTIKIETRDMRDILEFNEEEGSIVISASNKKMAGIKPGQILYSEKNVDGFPYGIVKKVTAVNEIEGKKIAKIVPASLEEAFNELHIFVENRDLWFNKADFDRWNLLWPEKYEDILSIKEKEIARLSPIINEKVSPQLYCDMEYIKDRNSILNPSDRWISDIKVISQVIPKQELYFEVANSVRSSLELEGSLILGGRVTLIYDYSGTTCDYFYVNLVPNETISFSFSIKGVLKPIKNEKDLLKIPATFLAGGIPITPCFEIAVGYETTLSSAMSVGVTEKGWIEIGGEYNGSKKLGDWRWWLKPGFDFSLREQIGVAAGIKGYIKPSLNLYVGQPDILALGAFGQILGYLEVRWQSSGLTLYGGITPSIGIKAKAFGFTLSEAGIEFSKYEKKILDISSKPKVNSFTINNNAASTTSRTVTLNNSCTGSPTHYIASESSSFSGATWKAYSTAPSFTLSSGNGTKTVYFKVKNAIGESAVSSDTILKR
jgi:hypothetical protein